tara:strand:- start:4798 stop:5658 length:861 start_codon:yes stop_codon:yes gene_type:complete
MRFLTIVFYLFICSCSLIKEESEDHVLARVEDTHLLVSDIEGIVPENASADDSTLIINNYIQNWVKDNLILKKAELNLKENQKDVQKQLEDYRRSLIVYSYEKELIKQRLDTVVLGSEIQDFYDNNNQNFELRDDIVKVLYLKVNKKAPQLKKIRKLYKYKKESDKDDLKELAHQYAEKFHLNDNLWILFEELQNEVPIIVSQTEGYLRNIKNIEVEDSLSIYFVHIEDYKLKNDVSPLSFEAKNIKNIIINKRKLSLINKIRSELYEEAFINKDIEIYNNQNENK